MNARIVLLAVFFFFLGFTAMASNIPGGVVFIENKNIVYHDFETEKKVNLTAGLKKEFDDNFVISSNGKIIFVTDNSKIWMIQFPGQKVSSLTAPYRAIKSHKTSEVDLVVLKIKNFSTSLDGQDLSFELEKPGTSLVFVPTGSPLDMWWKRQWGKDEKSPSPMFIPTDDSCNAIYSLHIDRSTSRVNSLTLNNLNNGVIPNYKSWGNTAYYPPAYPFRTNWKYFGKIENPANHTPKILSPLVATTANGLSYLPEQAIPRFSIKRNAYYCCWSIKSEGPTRMSAIIYQTTNGWGPIEIHGCNEFAQLLIKRNNTKMLTKEERNLKPGLYEINVHLPNCDGLAWKPDGSLVCFTDGKAFLFKKSDLDKNIEQSGIDKHPTEKYSFIPENNVFDINPELIASAVQGSGHSWVSDDQLIFRDKKGDLCLLKRGETSVLMRSIPKVFHYCARPEIDDQTIFMASEVSEKKLMPLKILKKN